MTGKFTSGSRQALRCASRLTKKLFPPHSLPIAARGEWRILILGHSDEVIAGDLPLRSGVFDM